MRAVHLRAPLDHARSPRTGWTREHWDELCRTLLAPIVAGASEGGARQPIPGPATGHGAVADEVEGFARTFTMAAAWLEGSTTSTCPIDGEEIDLAAFYARGIVTGTDPHHPEHWGPVAHGSQLLVESADIACGLVASRRHLWDHLSGGEQRQIAGYLLGTNGARLHRNNWQLFGVVLNSALKRLGVRHSQRRIDEGLRAVEGMHAGGGWYRDGRTPTFDLYNAWAFHYHLLQWARLDGDSRPDLAAEHRDRARQFVDDLRHLLGGDGGVPCFGRSATYRFAFVAPVVLGHAAGCLALTGGQARGLCSAAARFYCDQPILTDRGHLSLGFLRPVADVHERYSCGGSPYWAARAFHVLALPADDPFWAEPEAPLPVHEGDFVRALGPTGLVAAGDRATGHVQLLNHGSHHADPGFNDRYTRLAYSSTFTTDAAPPDGSSSCANALQFSGNGRRFHQRWRVRRLHGAPGFASSRASLAPVDRRGWVHTAVLVHRDCLVHLHLVRTTRQVVFKEGGYPLGSDGREVRVEHRPGTEWATVDGKVSFIRSLVGHDRQYAASDAHDRGVNLRYRDAGVPALGFSTGDRPGRVVVASLVCARVGTPSIDDLAAVVTGTEVVDGTGVLLRFDDGDHAFVRLGRPRAARLTLNGVDVDGDVVLARVSATGRATVLRAGGAVETVG